MNLFLHLWRTYRHRYWIVALSVVNKLTGILSTLCVGVLITSLSTGSGKWQVIAKPLVAVIALPFFNLILNVAQSRLSIVAAAKLELDFREYIWRHVSKIPLTRLYSDSPSVWMQKVCGDTSLVCGVFLNVLFSILGFVFSFIGICAAVFAKQPLMLLVFFAALAVGLVIHGHFRGEITDKASILREESYRFNSVAFDILMLHPLVKMFRLSERFTSRFSSVNTSLSQTRVSSELTTYKYNIALEVEMAVVHAAVFAGCVYFYLQDSLEIGEVFAFDMLISQLIGGVVMLLSTLPQIDQGLESARALASVIAIPEDVEAAYVGVAKEHVIEVDHLAFSYPEQKHKVINDVSFHIGCGEYVCIYGGNGSGKTTLLNLVLGIFKPTEGHVGMANPRISVIPQRILVFRDTVFENVRMFDDSVSEESVLSALASSGLGDWLARQGHGLHSQINCDVVSGGELQRLGVARAVVRNPDLLVVDEAANNLDIVEKLRVRTLLKNYRGRCTILAVTHDLEYINECDRVLVMKSGKLVELNMGDRSDAAKKIESMVNE